MNDLKERFSKMVLDAEDAWQAYNEEEDEASPIFDQLELVDLIQKGINAKQAEIDTEKQKIDFVDEHKNKAIKIANDFVIKKLPDLKTASALRQCTLNNDIFPKMDKVMNEATKLEEEYGDEYLDLMDDRTFELLQF